MHILDQKMEKAVKEGKVVWYYDNSYSMKDQFDDVFTRKFDNSLIESLPNYGFLGLPVKEIIKNYISNGNCYLSAVALSLLFEKTENAPYKNFRVVNCDLNGYLNYINDINHNYSGRKDFDHSFFVFEMNGRDIVIDASFGIIMEYDTYKDIFGTQYIKEFSVEELKETEVYRFLENNKGFIISSLQDKDLLDENKNKQDENKFYELINQHSKLCENFNSYENFYLTFFITKRLLSCSNTGKLYSIFMDMKNKVYSDKNLDFDIIKNKG